MKDPRKEKLRDLRRIARDGYSPSIYKLFDKYFPEVKQALRDAKLQHFFWLSPEWHHYHNQQHVWATKIAGYWDALGGAPSSSFRRMHNRLRRAKQRAAMCRAWHEDDWDDFSLPRERNTIRLFWW